MREVSREVSTGTEIESRQIYRSLIKEKESAVKTFRKVAKADRIPLDWEVSKGRDYGFWGRYYGAADHKWFKAGLGLLVGDQAKIAINFLLATDLPNLGSVELRELKGKVYSDLKSSLDAEGKQGLISPEQIWIGDVDSVGGIVHAFLLFPTEESFVNVFRGVSLKKG